MTGTSRPLNSGRKDALGRTVKIAADASAQRADAPAPGTDSDLLAPAQNRDEALDRFETLIRETGPGFHVETPYDAYQPPLNMSGARFEQIIYDARQHLDTDWSVDEFVYEVIRDEIVMSAWRNEGVTDPDMVQKLMDAGYSPNTFTERPVDPGGDSTV